MFIQKKQLWLTIRKQYQFFIRNAIALKKPFNPSHPRRKEKIRRKLRACLCFFGWHLQAKLVGGHSERSEESLTFAF
jgi:hypothetical protein